MNYIVMKQNINMRILFFDTETQGLPLSRYSTIQNVSNWPRIVSVSWQVYDFTNDSPKSLHNETFLVKPDANTPWSLEAEKIHGISKERALMEGRPIHEILTLFLSHANVDCIVSHNLAFDKPILLAEFLRNGLTIDWWPKMEYCTMENTKALCKLPPKTKNPKLSDPYKYPQLKELRSYLFQDTISDIMFHTANGDVQCLVDCFLELCTRQVVPLDQWRSRFSIRNTVG